MPETQYAKFRDLDRQCVAKGLDPFVCQEAVKHKRALIEFHQNNPIVRDVLAGKRTFVEAYETGSRAFRGFRRFIPHRADAEWNQQLEDLGRIIPNVEHFRRRGFLSVDNPVMCGVYGAAIAIGVSILGTHALRDDAVSRGGNQLLAGDDFPISLTLLAMIFGTLLGFFAMLRYRTRNPRHIHAREAAVYMDLNYSFYRTNADEAWSRCIQSKTEPENSRKKRGDRRVRAKLKRRKA